MNSEGIVVLVFVASFLEHGVMTLDFNFCSSIEAALQCQVTLLPQTLPWHFIHALDQYMG